MFLETNSHAQKKREINFNKKTYHKIYSNFFTESTVDKGKN